MKLDSLKQGKKLTGSKNLKLYQCFSIAYPNLLLYQMQRAVKPHYGSIPTPGVTGSQTPATVDSGTLARNAEGLSSLHPLG